MTSGVLLPPLIVELRTRAAQGIAGVKQYGQEAEAGAHRAETAMSGASGTFNRMAGVGKMALLGIAGGAIAVGAVSLKMGIDFQSATTQLVTGAGESERNIGMVRDGLIKMAPAVGMGPTALAKAMFLVESAGYHGAAGLTVMKAAAEGAKVGGAEATVVANGLTTALTDYHLSAAQAGTVTSQLVATVAAGKTNMQDLSGALSAVLPSAAAAHVGLAQVLGAMGTMTSEGISAQQASQDLAGTIRSLSNPSAVASKAMGQMGLNSTTVAQQLGRRGLTGTLSELTDSILHHMGPSGLVLENAFNQSKLAAQSADTELKNLPTSLQKLAQGYLNGTVTQKQWTAALKTQPALTASLGKQFATTAKEAHGFADTLKHGGGDARTYNAILSEMTGGATGLNTALALSGGNMGTFNTNVQNISKTTTEAGGHVKGWATTQKDLKTQLDQAKAGVEAMGTKIGMALIPWVEKAITLGATWVDWLTQHKPVLLAIAAVIGGVLAVSILTYVANLTIAAVTSVAQFATMIGEGVAWAASTVASAAIAAGAWIAANAAMILASGGILLALAALVAAVVWVATHWSQVWNDIKHWTGDAVNFILRYWYLLPFGWIIKSIVWVAQNWSSMWNWITTAARNSVNWIVGVAMWIYNNGFLPLWNALIGFWNFWQSLWDGVSAIISDVWNNYISPVIGWIEDAIRTVSGAISTVSHIASSVGGFIGKVGSFLGFEEGGHVPGPPGKAMLAVVHGGEYVLSTDMLSGRKSVHDGVLSNIDAGSGATGTVQTLPSSAASDNHGHPLEIHNHVYLDGKEIRHSVERKQLQVGARRVQTYQPYKR